MYLMIPSTLLLHILFDHLFIAVLPDGVRVVAACPELSSPEHLLHLCMHAKYLPGGDTLDDLHDRLRWHHGHTLNEEMHVILIGSNLHKMNLVSFRNAHADLLQGILDCFGECLPPILRRAYYVVEEESLVVLLVDMFAHPSILLHSAGQNDVYGKGVPAAELRGIF